MKFLTLATFILGISTTSFAQSTDIQRVKGLVNSNVCESQSLFADDARFIAILLSNLSPNSVESQRLVDKLWAANEYAITNGMNPKEAVCSAMIE